MLNGGMYWYTVWGQRRALHGTHTQARDIDLVIRCAVCDVRRRCRIDSVFKVSVASRLDY